MECICVQVKPFTPREFTCEGMLERLRAYITHQVHSLHVACHTQVSLLMQPDLAVSFTRFRVTKRNVSLQNQAGLRGYNKIVTAQCGVVEPFTRSSSLHRLHCPRTSAVAPYHPGHQRALWGCTWAPWVSRVWVCVGVPLWCVSRLSFTTSTAPPLSSGEQTSRHQTKAYPCAGVREQWSDTYTRTQVGKD